MEYVSVTKSISLLRNKDLPYSHHREVSKLEASQRATAKMLGVSHDTINKDVRNLTEKEELDIEYQEVENEDVRNLTLPEKEAAENHWSVSKLREQIKQKEIEADSKYIKDGNSHKPKTLSEVGLTNICKIRPDILQICSPPPAFVDSFRLFVNNYNVVLYYNCPYVSYIANNINLQKVFALFYIKSIVFRTHVRYLAKNINYGRNSEYKSRFEIEAGYF